VTAATATRRAAPGTHPLADLRRLRAELAGLRALVAEYLAADTGPQVTIATAGQWAADAARDAYERGWEAGRLDLIADEKRAQVGIVRALRESAPPPERWHVCCGPCRRGGHRLGCGRCEDRTQATFGQPHPDDYAPASVGAVQ
jgi:hypothetical protein